MVHPRLVLVSALLLAGCKKGEPPAGDDPPFTPESPQAKAIPAPLASSPTSASGSPGGGGTIDAGTAPIPMRGDSPVPPDSASKETGLAVSMTMALRTGDPGGPSKGPDVQLANIESLRKTTEPLVVIDIGATRARIVITGRGFVLPASTEIRARIDRYGHIVLWPDGRSYQVAAPGSLRALFQERRLDVSSFSPIQVSAPTEGPKRFGFRTRRIEMTTRIARASIDLGRVDGLGEGGVLVCRMIAELINAWPAISFPLTDEIPLHAEVAWSTGGSLVFDAVAFPHRTEVPIQTLATPPPLSRFSESMPTVPPGQQVLTEGELSALRIPATDPPMPPERRASLTLVNSTDRLRFVWLEGLPVAWIASGNRLTVSGLAPSHYTLQWRTFLGDSSEPSQVITAPGTLNLGVTD